MVSHIFNYTLNGGWIQGCGGAVVGALAAVLLSLQ